MILALRQYQAYLRLFTLLLPILAFSVTRIVMQVFEPTRSGGDFGAFLRLAVWTTMLWSAVASRFRLYAVDELLRQSTSILSTSSAVASTYALLGLSLFLAKEVAVSRFFVIASAATLCVMTLAMRGSFRVVIRRYSHRRHPIRVLMIGSDTFARRAAQRVSNNPFAHCRIVGYVRLPGQPIAVKGAVYDFDEVRRLDPTDLDDIVIAVPTSRVGEVQKIIVPLQRLCRPIRAVVDIGSNLVIRESLFQFGRLQLLDLSTTAIDSLQYRVYKRAFDLFFASVSLIILSPLFAVVALGIKLSSPGPILFRQQRVGLNGKVFTMLKYRTMHVAPECESDVKWTQEHDPRCTSFGKFLRHTSLDELPQFWNVLMGDMSVVGPRPERPHFVSTFRRDMDRYQHRHLAKVGITGWAQVNGFRGDTSIAKRLDYDLYYLQNWSLLFDLRIILMTIIFAMRHNAY